MLPWLNKFVASSGSQTAGYPVEELELLEKDFKPLDVLSNGVCQRIMEYIVTGRGDEVLQTLAEMRAASGGLALRCRRDGVRPTPDRDRFFASTTILDPAFHLRLALVYDAATQFNVGGRVGRVDVAPGLKGGAEFLDAYLWEALQVQPNVYPAKPKPSRLSAVEMEQMLALHGNPPSWFVRGALTIDPTDWGYATTAAGFIPVVPGFLDSLVRHVDMVRECLSQGDHRCKVHAIEVLQKAQFSPTHCGDVAAQLAVSTAKGVRKAAEAWISLDRAAVLPHLQRLAAAAEPTERFHAVKLLAKIGGDKAQSFLGERLASEKSIKVRELIKGILNPQSQVDLEAEGLPASLPALPELPDVLADQALDDSVLNDLKTVIEKTNAEWLAEWEKSKGQKWSPKEPTQFARGAAEEWFHLLQTLDSGVHPQVKIQGGGLHATGALIEFAGHPKFRLVHVFRWAALLNREQFTARNFWHGGAIQCLDAWIEKHGPVDYRELAAICQRLHFPTEWIASAWLTRSEYNARLFNTQAGEHVWPYFAERLDLLEMALGWIPNDPHGFVPTYWESNYKLNAWRALAAFPVPPASFMDRMWEAALGSSKTERPLAQEALGRAPNRESRLIAALSSGQQDQRLAAADWIGRLRLNALIPALRASIAKEKYDTPKAAMIGALERLGVSPDEFLDREGLLKDARKITAKPLPAALEWFPMKQLPAVHWSDNGAAVAPEIIEAWLIQACKLKQVEPSALVRRYAASFRAEEREALGQFILDAWLAEDLIVAFAPAGRGASDGVGSIIPSVGAAVSRILQRLCGADGRANLCPCSSGVFGDAARLGQSTRRAFSPSPQLVLARAPQRRWQLT